MSLVPLPGSYGIPSKQHLVLLNVILANPEVSFAGLERQSRITEMLGNCSTNEL